MRQTLQWLVIASIIVAANSRGLQPVNASPAAATWFVNVNTGSDDNDCASAGTACKTIALAILKSAAGDTLQIAAGLYPEPGLEINHNLTLQGAGRETTIIDGQALDRVLKSNAPTTLADLTIRNGRVVTTSTYTYDNMGGGIQHGDDLSLRNVAVISNFANFNGGGIVSFGKLTISGSTFERNMAGNGPGGAIAVVFVNPLSQMVISSTSFLSNTASGNANGGALSTSAPLTMTDVLVQGNVAGGLGGGLDVDGPVWLERVALVGNTAENGAALASFQGKVNMRNTTVSGNVARNNFGGIYLYIDLATLDVRNSTIAGNSRIATSGTGHNGIFVVGNAVRLVNTLLANAPARNCGGQMAAWLSAGNNLSTDFNCQLTGTNDLPGAPAGLAPLALRDGTWVHALLPGSAALDAGSTAECLALDQRKIVRPQDGDAIAGAICDIGAFESRAQASIVGRSVQEGNAGAQTHVFTATLSPPPVSPMTMTLETLNGTATAGSDFTAINSTLSFAAGQSSAVITLSVTGDTEDEADETLTLRLSTIAPVELISPTAVVTILDNDGLPALALGDAGVTEGNSGTRNMVFTVTLSPASVTPVTFTVATQNASATAGSDFVALSAARVMAPGQTSLPVTVTINGDILDEPTQETFSLTLSSPQGALLGDAIGVGTIVDDDTTIMSLRAQPPLAEGDVGFRSALVTVTLSAASDTSVTVDYALTPGVGVGGAKPGLDYFDQSGTLTFAPGETGKTITVQIISDGIFEPDEIFYIALSNASVPLGTNVDNFLILNDDRLRVFLPLAAR